MTNQKRTLIIMLVVFAILMVLILVFIPRLTASNSEPAEPAEEKTYLCPLSRSDVERIEYTRDGATTVLIRADSTWAVEGSAETPNSDVTDNMLSAVCGLYSKQVAFTGEEHFADCGLDEPTLTVTASGPNGAVTIRVGGYNNGLDRWYCTVDGGDTIYLIGNNLCTRYSADLF